MKYKVGVGTAHASFGELLQGRLPSDNRSFLVTLPIEKFTKAMFYPSEDTKEIVIIPKYKVKTKKAVELLMEERAISCGGTLYIESDIPEGKGLSSSSADLVAGLRAFSSSFNIEVTNDEIGRIMAQIEPSDAVMYDSTVIFYNCDGMQGDLVKNLPNFTIIGVDDGGNINTEDCYKTIVKRNEELAQKYQRMLKAFIRAANSSDIWEIGRISTESSIMNQEVIYKKSFDKLLEIKEKHNLPGIVTSHTGTYIGLIVNHDENFICKMNKVAQSFLEHDLSFSIFNTISKSFEKIN